MRGGGESGGGLVAVAIVIVERNISGDVLIKLRRAGLGALAGDSHRGQRLDIERYRFGGVFGLRDGLGHHIGDRIADEANFVGGERVTRRHFQRLAVAALERKRAFEPAIGGEVGGGINAEHARHGLGGGGVDALDDAVRDRTAHHYRIRLTREINVVGVAAFAAHQLGVFGAAHRLADAEFGQRKGCLGGSVIHAGALGVVAGTSIR